PADGPEARGVPARAKGPWGFRGRPRSPNLCDLRKLSGATRSPTRPFYGWLSLARDPGEGDNSEDSALRDRRCLVLGNPFETPSPAVIRPEVECPNPIVEVQAPAPPSAELTSEQAQAVDQVFSRQAEERSLLVDAFWLASAGMVLH